MKGILLAGAALLTIAASPAHAVTYSWQGDLFVTAVNDANACATAGLRVGEADLRRGVELQAKSHLIHLREGYIESGGNPKAVGQLIAASAPSLSSLLGNLRRLDPAAAERAGISGELFREIATAADTTIADPSALLARYLLAVERLWQEVDRWRA